MTRRFSMGRTLWAIVAIAAAVVSAACTNGSSDTPAQPLEDPPFSELSDGSTYDETPEPMAFAPSTILVVEMSTGGATRRDAESFAIAFAQLQSDTREFRIQTAFLSQTLSPRADVHLRQYLLREYELQRGLGTDRYYDPRDEAWVRSKVVGEDDSPTRVMVEIAAVLVSDALQVRVASRSRVDVTREGDSWKVVAYASAIYGPHNLAPGEPADLENQLKGPAWRRLPER